MSLLIPPESLEEFNLILQAIEPLLTRKELWTEEAVAGIFIRYPGIFPATLQILPHVLHGLRGPDIGNVLTGALLTHFIIGYRLGQLSFAEADKNVN